MNRNEADLILRHYTHEHAAKVPAADDDDASIARLTRELSYYIDASLSTGYIEWIVHFCRKANTDFDAESDLNFEINAALDAANIRGPHILRYTTQETHA